jgi:hypothetical protein
MKRIHAHIKIDKQKNNNATPDSHGQAEDVNYREQFILYYVAAGYFKIVFKHDS